MCPVTWKPCVLPQNGAHIFASAGTHSSDDEPRLVLSLGIASSMAWPLLIDPSGALAWFDDVAGAPLSGAAAVDAVAVALRLRFIIIRTRGVRRRTSE